MRTIPRPIGRRATGAVAALVVLLLAAALVVVRGTADDTYVAYFSSTDGIYPGDEVRVLGVPVGTIDDIEAQDGRVKVTLSVASDVEVPADAKAIIVAPSLVSSRYVQLTPRYSGGARLADGAEIPLARTATPVEWETVKTQLNDVVTALGPDGSDKDGALSRLLSSTSAALDGRGATLNGAIENLASALTTLDAGGDDLFSTVRNLQVFVSALAQSDQQVGDFITRLDQVSASLVGDEELVAPALDQLSKAVGEVDTFVADHRAVLDSSLEELAGVASIVAKRQNELAQTLHVAPHALENLNRSYKERQNAVSVDLHGANIHSPGQLVCGAFGGVSGGLSGGSEQDVHELCSNLVGDLLDQTTTNPVSQELLNALLLLLSGGPS